MLQKSVDPRLGENIVGKGSVPCPLRLGRLFTLYTYKGSIFRVTSQNYTTLVWVNFDKGVIYADWFPFGQVSGGNCVGGVGCGRWRPLVVAARCEYTKECVNSERVSGLVGKHAPKLFTILAHPLLWLASETGCNDYPGPN